MILNSAQWERAEALVDRCLRLTEEDCDRILAEECSDEFAIKEVVQQLISRARSARNSLQTAIKPFDNGESLLQGSTAGLLGRALSQRFTVLALIGAGGMGEVFRARDERLGRIVAIKVLRPELMQNPVWRLRFKQEARTISSLSHAHICAVYDLEQSDDLAFLIMEYLSGETLSDRLSHGPLPLADLSCFAHQIGEALGYAHDHGIIHRDLKPNNVILTESGVKLLDFGLAKQIKTNSENTVTAITGEVGSIMGTIAYMSPEQAQGQILDARSDIFSFGSVLYEMAAGRRAFPGATPLSALAEIIHSDPIAPSKLRGDLPPAVDKIVSRCLQKSASMRYRHMGEVLAEFHALNEPYSVIALRDPPPLSSLDLPYEIARPSSQLPATPHAKRYRVPSAVAATIAFLCAAIIAIFWSRNTNHGPAFANIRITKFTANGNAFRAAVSPDGNLIAYAAKENGALVLRLKSTRGGQSVILVPSIADDIADLGFTENGSYVSLVTHPSSQPAIRALTIIPVDGGDPKQVMETFSGPVNISSDGKRVAYAIANGDASRDELWISDVSGANRHLLRSFRYPERLSWESLLQWSPDGSMLACAIKVKDKQGNAIQPAVIETQHATIHRLSSARWQSVEKLAWMNSSGLMVTGQEQDSPFRQIWYIPYPKGEARRITNDLSNYTGISVDAKGTSLVAVQLQTISNIFVSEPDTSSAGTQITPGNGRYFDISYMRDGRILFASDATGFADLWVTGADGEGERQLTSAFGRSYAPAASPDGRSVVFQSSRGGSWNIWRMTSDGGDITQLTAGSEDSNWPQVTPDGKWVIYHHTGINGKLNLFRIPIKGGQPEQLTESEAKHPAISWKDGRIAAWYTASTDKPKWKLAVLPPGGGKPIRVFDVALNVESDSAIHWAPEGDGIAYRDFTNIWLQKLDGSPPRRLTSFTSQQIYSFDWSLDGHVAFSRGISLSDVVLIRDRNSQVD